MRAVVAPPQGEPSRVVQLVLLQDGEQGQRQVPVEVGVEFEQQPVQRGRPGSAPKASRQGRGTVPPARSASWGREEQAGERHVPAALGPGSLRPRPRPLRRVVRAAGPAIPARRPGMHYSIRHLMVGDLAEAAHYAGNLDEVRALLPEVTTGVRRMGSPAGEIALAHARAMLANGQDREASIERALDAVGMRRPFVRARLQLALGVWLRRQRRSASRARRCGPPGLGSTPWARELGRSGPCGTARLGRGEPTAGARRGGRSHAPGAADRPARGLGADQP